MSKPSKPISPRPAAAADRSIEPVRPHQDTTAPGQVSNNGTRRITSLEELEVLPPIKRSAKGQPMPLAEIEDHIRQFDARIEDRTRGYHNEVIYDIVGKGLMLLKGRAEHLNITGRPKSGETVSPLSKKEAKQLVKLEEKGEQGFLSWFDTTFPGQQIRTARNYMNAARNAGLTSDHGLEDVEALRTALALHEKKPTDLYRLADKVSETPPEDTTPPPNLVADTQRDLFAYLDQALVLRDQMDAEVFEAVHVRLHATLEKLTGAKWIMADEAPSTNGAQHGDLHANGHANDVARRHAKVKAKAAQKKAAKRK